MEIRATESKISLFLQEPEQKLKYPKGVFLIIITEFCERFSFFGVQCILILYLRNVLSFTDATSKIIFHTFCALVYAYPILGALIADSWLGKYNTILWMSVVLICGNILMTLSSIKIIVNMSRTSVCLIGLLVIAIGSGGIKPCITPFGGDQFIVPQQYKLLQGYFTVFYFAMNIGSLSSTIITPVLKDELHCFQEMSCYSAAFGLSVFLMIIALILMIIGKPLYRILKPQNNVILLWIRCVGFGIKMKIKSTEKASHWLDRCEEKFGPTFVKEVKITTHVLLLFTPTIIFWALYDQQGSGWTLQATQMSRDFGTYRILPEQMITASTFLILIFIPIFSYGIYPLFAKCGLITKPLQRMTCGGLLTAISFMIAAYISIIIECNRPIYPQKGECHIRIYNPLLCYIKINALPYIDNVEIKPMGYKKIEVKNITGENLVPYNVTGCEDILNKTESGNILRVAENATLGYFMSTDGLIYFEDDISRHKELAKVRFIVGTLFNQVELTYWQESLNITANEYSLLTFEPGPYTLANYNQEIMFYSGGVYTALIHFDGENIKDFEVYEITEHNRIHVLWLLPQYIFLSAGTVMLCITGTEFASTQAPSSMKAVMSAAWLLTSSLGNITIIIVEASEIFEKQSSRFLLYSGLMIMAMGVFGYLARNYKYVQHTSPQIKK